MLWLHLSWVIPENQPHRTINLMFPNMLYEACLLGSARDSGYTSGILANAWSKYWHTYSHHKSVLWQVYLERKWEVLWITVTSSPHPLFLVWFALMTQLEEARSKPVDLAHLGPRPQTILPSSVMITYMFYFELIWHNQFTPHRRNK